MRLNLFSDEPGRNIINESDADYKGDKLACPRCRWTMWDLFTRRTGRREMVCDNCGYSGQIADGVEVHRSDD